MNPNLKFLMKNKQYIFHTDPGHGWLAVKEKELQALGLLEKVSGYSYIKGKTVYLEEDCDASLFITAYETVFGKKPAYRESYLERTPIRYYAGYPAYRYVPDTTQPTWEDTARMWITGDTE